LQETGSEEVERRMGKLLLAVALSICLLVGRLGYLQVVRGSYYEALARGNRIRLVSLTAPRGTILDRNGELIATTRPAFAASLVYMGEPYSDEMLAKLESILSLPAGRIRDLLAKQSGRLYLPVRIKTDITPEEHSRLEECRHELPGLVIEALPIREYPYGQLAAHVFGYVGELAGEDPKLQELAAAQVSLRSAASLPQATYEVGDIVGVAGLERQYDSILRGLDGTREVEVDSRGTPTRTEREDPPEAGLDLKLTIDLRLQQALEVALAANMDKLRQSKGIAYAPAGCAVVLDVKTGAVRAMASLPAYDPNAFASGNVDVATVEWLNRVTQGKYIPGSTYKMITAMAALEEGVVTPKDTVYCPGGYRLGSEFIRCWIGAPGHGTTNLVQAVQRSCNTFFLEMGMRLRNKMKAAGAAASGPARGGLDILADYAAEFGLDGPTGIDLPGERAGTVPRTGSRALFTGEDIQHAIGQSTHVYSPLQLAQYVATIASNGTRMRPYLVEEVLKDGEVLYRFQPEVSGTVAKVSQPAFHVVKSGMLGVTGPGGTAYWAFWDLPIKVAGKTGTAQTGRLPDNALFAGFAPFDDPEIAFFIIVEGGDSGSLTCGPVAREIVRTYFGLGAPAADQSPAAVAGE
jgi:penicillin-binding protein 2